MKFLHLADLHLGKNLVNRQLVESGDQPYMLQRILAVIDEQKPDAVLISGDVYDRGVPARDAVPLLSNFLTELALKRNLKVLMISGNHDSAERLGFGSELLANMNVHIAGSLTQELMCVPVERDGEDVNFYLLPYVEPLKVRALFNLSSEEVPDTEAAVRVILEKQNIDFSKKNVLLAHQFVTASGEKPVESKSETSLGGSGGVDYRVFDGFDYVALGHIHNAQAMGRSAVRYAGSPMPYHFSEVGQRKGALMVTLGEQGEEPKLELFPLPLLHPMRCVVGKFADILQSEEAVTARDEYISVTLTDSDAIRDASEQLRSLVESHGSYLVDLSFAPENLRREEELYEDVPAEEKSMAELFAEFFKEQRDRKLNEKEKALVAWLCEKIENNADESDKELIATLTQVATEQEDAE